MIKRAIVSITYGMRGAFLPRRICQNDLTEFVLESLSSLSYYGPEHDAKNMREDLCRLGKDMKKSKEGSKRNFKIKF